MFISKILGALIFSTAVFAAEKQNLNPQPFKGNWTEKFSTNTPLGEIVHTPTYVKVGFMQSGGEISLAPSTNYMGYSLPATLHIKTDSTRNEFVEALKKAKIYNGK